MYMLCVCVSHVCVCITCPLVYMFHAIWEFAQSADCIVQTEDPLNVCQSACILQIAQY